MATKLNPNAIIDSSVTKEKIQQWVIKWDDAEIDAAIWDELEAFDQLPSKIPNIVFMDEYFNVFPLRKIEDQGTTRNLYFGYPYNNEGEPNNTEWYISTTVVTVKPPLDGKCALIIDTGESLCYEWFNDILEDRISGGTLQDNSVEGTKLKDASVTPAKLAPSVMQHLEAITIYTDNTAEHKAANLANIKAYEDNLKALGVDTAKDNHIPIAISGTIQKGFLVGNPVTNRYQGMMGQDTQWSVCVVGPDGTFPQDIVLTDGRIISSLTTTNKQIIPAINEVNAKIGDIDTILDNIIG